VNSSIASLITHAAERWFTLATDLNFSATSVITVMEMRFFPATDRAMIPAPVCCTA
jgi:hypothetical protein